MREILVMGPLVVVSTYLQAVIAQAPDVEVSGNLIIGLLGNAGIVGALIWYMYYTKTKSDPKMLDTFAAQLEAQRVSSEAKFEKVRVTFEAQIERMREVFEKQLEKMREYAERERQNSVKETAELRVVMLEMMKNMRVAVHDVKDTANTAIMKSSAAEMQARKEQAESRHDKT